MLDVSEAFLAPSLGYVCIVAWDVYELGSTLPCHPFKRMWEQVWAHERRMKAGRKQNKREKLL